MARIAFIPEKDWEIVKKYLGMSEDGLIILPEPVEKALEPEIAKLLHDAEEGRMPGMEPGARPMLLECYDFGEEPDVRIDIIHDESHYAVSELLHARAMLERHAQENVPKGEDKNG